MVDGGVYKDVPNKNARTSWIWNIFNSIIDENKKVIGEFYWCKICKKVVHGPKRRGSTSELSRHPCAKEYHKNDGTTNETVQFDQSDYDLIRSACANFVSFDLRPMRAVECDGFLEVFLAGVLLGQKYPSREIDDFKKICPSRNTVKNDVTEVAQKAKTTIKSLFRNALLEGGFGVTLDLWSDN